MQRILSIAAGLLLVAAPLAGAAAQGRSGSATVPQATPGGAGSSQGSGVITPPPANDPGIAKAPPAAGESRTKVIRPPGSPGGDKSVQPR